MTSTTSCSSLPDSPGIRLEPHACNRNRTLSPQASPMVELFVPSREPVTGNTDLQRQTSGRVGNDWGLGLGPGPWGIPLWPHVCWNEGQQYLLWTGHQEERESRGGGYGFKVGVGGGGVGAKTNNLGTFPWKVEGEHYQEEMQFGGAGRHGELEV